MAFDAGLAISLSIVGIVMTFALVTIVDIITRRSKEDKRNQSPMTG